MNCIFSPTIRGSLSFVFLHGMAYASYFSVDVLLKEIKRVEAEDEDDELAAHLEGLDFDDVQIEDVSTATNINNMNTTTPLRHTIQDGNY